MTVTLGKWEKNGIKRIYVNGAPIGGSKLWFESDSRGKIIDRVNTYGVPGMSGTLDKAIEAGYKALEQLTGGEPWNYDTTPDFNTIFAAL
jgi:hypothetical protein